MGGEFTSLQQQNILKGKSSCTTNSLIYLGKALVLVYGISFPFKDHNSRFTSNRTHQHIKLFSDFFFPLTTILVFFFHKNPSGTQKYPIHLHHQHCHPHHHHYQKCTFIKLLVTLLSSDISSSEYISCIPQAASSTCLTAICASQQNCVLPLKDLEIRASG